MPLTKDSCHRASKLRNCSSGLSVLIQPRYRHLWWHSVINYLNPNVWFLKDDTWCCCGHGCKSYDVESKCCSREEKYMIQGYLICVYLFGWLVCGSKVCQYWNYILRMYCRLLYWQSRFNINAVSNLQLSNFKRLWIWGVPKLKFNTRK